MDGCGPPRSHKNTGSLSVLGLLKIPQIKPSEEEPRSETTRWIVTHVSAAAAAFKLLITSFRNKLD